jgi:small multidrug resistance family-3 protein
MIRYLIVVGLLILATTLETTGDAFVRIGIYDRSGLDRVSVLGLGAILLFGYGFFLNLAPLPFERVVGLYIATLFIVWQVVSYFTFKTIPNLTIIAGGILIVAGGLLVSFGDAAAEISQ